MYKLITIFVVFLMTGCASNQFNDSRNTKFQCEDLFWSGCTKSSHEVSDQFNDKFSDVFLIYKEQKIDIESDYNHVPYPKAEAINLETGNKFHFGHTVLPSACTSRNYNERLHCPTSFVKEFCEGVYGSECILSRFNDEIYYMDINDYNFKIEQKRLAKIEKEEAEKRMLETKKQDAFNKLYSTCIGYGFEEQNTIASCIQQEIFNEKKLAILKEQQLAQLQYTNNQQTKEKEETGFWLQVLEGVAENLADPNTWENARQNAEIQRLKNQQRRTIPKICSGTSCN